MYFENSSVMHFQQIRLLVGVYLGGKDIVRAIKEED